MAKADASVKELVNMIERGELRLTLEVYPAFLSERRKRLTEMLNVFLGTREHMISA